MQLRILYQDDSLVAIDKPAGFHVHPPEDQRHRISPASNCLHILRRQIDRYLFPVHRLDGATSGVVLFALDPASASAMQGQFARREIEKTYFGIARGWVGESGLVDSPLSGVECKTSFKLVARTELPVAISRHATSRYSLVEIAPLTGRMHQIRRHFSHLRYPLIGDSLYGDGKHNRFFREKIQGSGLFLKAYSVHFKHPVSGKPLSITGRWNRPWLEAFDLFGICPFQAAVIPSFIPTGRT